MTTKRVSEGKMPPTNPKTVKLKDVVEQMRDDGCEFFVDSTNQPTVMIAGDGFQQDWPANHERVQDFLITLYYDLSDGQTLKPSDLQLLMALLREECRNGGRRLSQEEEAKTDGDTIVQLILCLMSTDEFSGPTSRLLEKLKELEKTKLPYSDELPAFLNVFSRRLRRRIPILRGFGVAVSLEHKESGSTCTLTRLPSFQAQVEPDGSQAASSDGSPARGKGLAPADDTDGQIRKEGRRGNTEPTDAKGGAK